VLKVYEDNQGCCVQVTSIENVTEQCVDTCFYDDGVYQAGFDKVGTDAWKLAMETLKCCKVETRVIACDPSKKFSQAVNQSCINGNCKDVVLKQKWLENQRYCDVQATTAIVPTNVTESGKFSFGCLGTPLWLMLLPVFCAPLLLYLLWWPISIMIAKFLLKNKGPIHGRKRRLLAKKAYDIMNEATQNAVAGDPRTQVFVATNIPCKTSAQNKIYTLDGHILDDPKKDKHKGHAAKVEEMKKQVQEKSGLPPAEQKLVYKGVELVDGTNIADYSIPTNSTIWLNPKARPIKIRARVKGSSKPQEFIIDADDSYSIAEVKQAIRDCKGLPITQQQLWMNGNELQAMVGLNDLGADGIPVLHLNPITGKMPIQLIDASGNVTTLQVKATHKIGNIKKRLEKDGLFVGEGRMVYEGEQMGDKDCLIDHDVPANGMVFLNPAKYSMPMKLPSGEIVNIDVDPSFTVGALKTKMFEYGVEITNMRIMMETDGENGAKSIMDMPDDQNLHQLGLTRYGASNETPLKPLLVNPIVVMDGQKIIPVDITPSMTVQEMKVKIQEATGLAPADQHIIYEPNSIVDGLNDSMKLSQYGITENGNATMYLNPNRLQVPVKMPDGQTHMISLDIADTVETLQKKIQDGAFGVPIPEQALFYDGKPLPKKGLIGGFFKEGHPILLNPITIDDGSGTLFPVDINMNGTVRELKIAIEAAKGTPVDGQQVCFRGQDMDEGKILASYGVGDSSRFATSDAKSAKVIYLNPKPFELSIKANNGETFNVPVDASYTIDQVRDTVAARSRTPIADVKLVHVAYGDSKVLETGTLHQFGIKSATKLYLNPENFRIFVKLPNNKVIVVEVNSCDVPWQVRKKAEPIARIGSLDETILVYGVEEMEETLCLADYEVVADSTIRVVSADSAKSTGDKKWADVDTGNLFRGQAGRIKVDYGPEGLALPQQAEAPDAASGLAKFKAKAQAIKAIKAMGGQVPTAAPEEIDISDAEQDEAELEAKRRESRTYSMIRAVAAEHVAAQKPNAFAKQPTYNKSLMNLDEGVDKDDIDYKYTACLMKCCPCLAPKEEEEAPPAKTGAKLTVKPMSGLA